MENIEKAVRYYLEDHMDTFLTLHEVEITTQLFIDDAVFAAADYPGAPKSNGMNLEVTFSVDTVPEFISTFDLRSAEQINQIKPQDLMELYHQDKGEVSCFIDGHYGYSMYFRKQGKLMFARDDEDKEHEMAVVLETPQQFMDYTLQQFQIAALGGRTLNIED
jgi:hypothetical protein